VGSVSVALPVKLITGIIFCDVSDFKAIRKHLQKKFGAIDHETEEMDFSGTSYYEKEFGVGLKKKIFSFKRLFKLQASYKIKLFTNDLEKQFTRNRTRLVNIDPGYVTLAKLVLLTTKNHSHRIYLDHGIYASLDLRFQKNSFFPVEWTYPDYRQRAYIDFFNTVRKTYAAQLKH